MANIPKSILDRIRRRMFRFLWTGKKEKEIIHLVIWNRIAKPKKNGGWGFTNILCFGKALTTKSLWTLDGVIVGDTCQEDQQGESHHGVSHVTNACLPLLPP
jgi:hypothetical protein